MIVFKDQSGNTRLITRMRGTLDIDGMGVRVVGKGEDLDWPVQEPLHVEVVPEDRKEEWEKGDRVIIPMIGIGKIDNVYPDGSGTPIFKVLMDEALPTGALHYYARREELR